MAAEWIWERVDDMFARYDAAIDIKGTTGCAWEGQLRLTLTNPTSEPSRSMTIYSAGGGDPEEVAEALLADAEAWIAESGQQPLPPPAWMLDGGER